LGEVVMTPLASGLWRLRVRNGRPRTIQTYVLARRPVLRRRLRTLAGDARAGRLRKVSVKPDSPGACRGVCSTRAVCALRLSTDDAAWAAGNSSRRSVGQAAQEVVAVACSVQNVDESQQWRSCRPGFFSPWRLSRVLSGKSKAPSSRAALDQGKLASPAGCAT